MALGARAVIRHDIEDVVSRTLELTGGKGADRILDMVGGDATRQHVEAAARFGHIVVVSAQADRNASLPLNRFVANQLTLSGSTLRHQPGATKAAIAATLRERLWPALPDLIHPKIQHFALSEAAAAHRAMEDRAHFGKIVLVTAFGNR